MQTDAAERELTLLEITDSITQAFEALDAPDLTADETQALEAAIEHTITTELAKKTDGVAWFVKRTEGEIEQLKALQAAVDEKIAAKQKRIGSIRDLCKIAMQRLGQKKLAGKVHTISLRPGSESVCVTDLRAVPAQYQIVSTSLDKAAIRKALKAGVEVPGAALSTGEESIQIR